MTAVLYSKISELTLTFSIPIFTGNNPDSESLVRELINNSDNSS